MSKMQDIIADTFLKPAESRNIMTKFAVFIKKVLVAHLDKKFPTFYLT
jgi:hypothetical protein